MYFHDRLDFHFCTLAYVHKPNIAFTEVFIGLRDWNDVLRLRCICLTILFFTFPVCLVPTLHSSSSFYLLKINSFRSPFADEKPVEEHHTLYVHPCKFYFITTPGHPGLSFSRALETLIFLNYRGKIIVQKIFHIWHGSATFLNTHKLLTNDCRWLTHW